MIKFYGILAMLAVITSCATGDGDQAEVNGVGRWLVLRMPTGNQTVPQAMMHGFKQDSMVAKGSPSHSKIPPMPIAADRGQKVYKNYCEFCHGPTGRGDGPGASQIEKKPADLRLSSLSTNKWEFFILISEGKGEVMPSWKEILSKDEIADLSSYLATLSQAK